MEPEDPWNAFKMVLGHSIRCGKPVDQQPQARPKVAGFLDSQVLMLEPDSRRSLAQSRGISSVLLSVWRYTSSLVNFWGGRVS